MFGRDRRGLSQAPFIGDQRRVLHVVHHPDYVVPETGSLAQFNKYALVMDLLRVAGDLTVHEPGPMPLRWLEAAHDPDYVQSVLNAAVPRAIERRIGFAVTAQVARRAQISPGGTWLAAKLALRHGYAANAAGGSHHALPDSGAGYCVFNDLAIAALRLLGEGEATRILIVDCDVHQGDGTAVILAGHPSIATLSIHADKNFPARKTRSTCDVALPDGTGDKAYLAALASALATLVEDRRPDLILYQAGVDVHEADKLGRLALTDAGIAARDVHVAETAHRRGIPLASVMGGGYGNDVMAVAKRHAAVMRTCASVITSC